MGGVPTCHTAVTALERVAASGEPSRANTLFMAYMAWICYKILEERKCKSTEIDVVSQWPVCDEETRGLVIDPEALSPPSAIRLDVVGSAYKG